MGKSHDDLAVAIWRNSSSIGHVPWEFSQVCWYFLQKSANEITFIVSGDRKTKGDCVARPCVYVFRGNEILITPFTKLTASNWFYKRFTDYSMQ